MVWALHLYSLCPLAHHVTPYSYPSFVWSPFSLTTIPMPTSNISYHHSHACIHGIKPTSSSPSLLSSCTSYHTSCLLYPFLFLYRIPTYTFLPLLYHMQTTFHAIHHPFLSHHFPSTCKILTMPTLLSPHHGIPHHHAHSPTPSWILRHLFHFYTTPLHAYPFLTHGCHHPLIPVITVLTLH